MTSIRFSSDNIQPTIYGYNMHSENVQGTHLSFFYLHGELEELNNYDCCNGNIEAFSYALSLGYFLCDVFLTDGSKHRGICFTSMKHNRMSGLICSLTDLENIKLCRKKYSTHAFVHFEKELENYYPEVWKIIKEKPYTISL